MIQGHWNDDPIMLRCTHAFPDEEAIIQDVMVAQGGTFGEAGGPWGELDVGWVLKAIVFLPLFEFLGIFQGG